MWDINLFRKRKMTPLLSLLEIQPVGFHAFRHRLPPHSAQDQTGAARPRADRLDDACANWKENEEAAKLADEAIKKAVNSVSVNAIRQKGLPILASEALSF